MISLAFKLKVNVFSTLMVMMIMIMRRRISIFCAAESACLQHCVVVVVVVVMVVVTQSRVDLRCSYIHTYMYKQTFVYNATFVVLHVCVYMITFFFSFYFCFHEFCPIIESLSSSLPSDLYYINTQSLFFPLCCFMCLLFYLIN